MRTLLLIALAGAFALSTVGATSCGTSDSLGGGSSHKSKAQRRAAKRLKARRAAKRLRARRAARVHTRRHTAARSAAPTRAAAQPQCDPNYSGACLDPNASDYDCLGGSGDGPKYTGTVTVVGVDHYDLNRDSDNIACEP
jgi:hypothetical protein